MNVKAPDYTKTCNALTTLFRQRWVDQGTSPQAKKYKCTDWVEELKDRSKDLMGALDEAKIVQVHEAIGSVVGSFAALIAYAEEHGINLEYVIQAELARFAQRKPWLKTPSNVPTSIEQEKKAVHENITKEQPREF